MNTRVMVFEEKHIPRFFVINDEVDVRRVLASVAVERLNDGYWYDERESHTLQQLVASGQSKRVAEWMAMRSAKGYKYETYVVYPVESPKHHID